MVPPGQPAADPAADPGADARGATPLVEPLPFFAVLALEVGMVVAVCTTSGNVSGSAESTAEVSVEGTETASCGVVRYACAGVLKVGGLRTI